MPNPMENPNPACPSRWLAAWVCLILLTGLPALAEQPCNPWKHLNLSKAQQQKLQSLNATFQKDNTELIRNLQSKHSQLQSLNKVQATPEQQQELQAAIHQGNQQLHDKRMSLLSKVLTTEQLNQFQVARTQCKASQAPTAKSKR